jgi:hypothetical protein
MSAPLSAHGDEMRLVNVIRANILRGLLWILWKIQVNPHDRTAPVQHAMLTHVHRIQACNSVFRKQAAHITLEQDMNVRRLPKIITRISR